MADLGENIRSFLVGSTGVAAQFDDITLAHVVEQNRVAQDVPQPRIWFRRNAEVKEPDLGGTVTHGESTWDIECQSKEVDQAQNIATEVKTVLNAHRGTFGANSIQGAFVFDHDDQYIVKGLSDDDGTFVAALSVTIFST